MTREDPPKKFTGERNDPSQIEGWFWRLIVIGGVGLIWLVYAVWVTYWPESIQ